MSKNTGTSELINYFDLGVNGDVGIAGSLDINTIANATTDTDTFLVSDTGIIKYRTGAQLLSDIGAQAAGNYVTTDTSQAITANKSFTVGFSLASEGSGNQTSFFRNTSSIFSGSGGSNIFGFNNSNNIYFGKGLNNGGVLQWNNTTATRYYTLPDADGTIALTSNIPANAVGGTGTTNYLAKFTGASTIGNSVIQESSSLIGINVTPTRVLHLSSSGTNAAIRLDNTTSGRPFLLTYDDSQNLTFINSSDSGYIAFNSGTGTSTTKMLLTNSGNLGLGVTPSAWGAAFKAIQILNQASISAEADLIASSVNAFYDTSWKYIANGVATNYYQNNGQHVWRNATSGTAGNAITWSVPMTLTSGGNLLVGTTTDAGYKLDVNGTGRFSGRVTIGNDVGYALTYGRYSAGIPISYLRAGTDSTGGFRLTNHNGADVIVVNGSNAITLDGALSVTGAATFSSTVRINADGQSLLIFPTTTNSVRMQIQSTGGGNLVVGTENSTGGILATGTNAYASVFTSGSTRDLVLGTNSTARLTINGTSGNVLINSNMGIGTGFTPAYPLHIYTSVADWGVVVQNLNASSYGMYVRGGATNGSTSAFFVANTAGTTLLDIKGSGAAYFLSSVNVNGAADISGHLIVRGTLPADQTDAAVIDHFSNTMRIFSYGAAGVTGDFQFRTAAGGAGSNLVSTINGTTGAYTAVSDINKKKDFEESTIGLNAILGLKPTLYRMKSENNTQKHLGFIAQEVRQYIPNAYVENGEFIGLNEMPIIAALTKAIQEQQQQIQELKNKLS